MKGVSLQRLDAVFFFYWKPPKTMWFMINPHTFLPTHSYRKWNWVVLLQGRILYPPSPAHLQNNHVISDKSPTLLQQHHSLSLWLSLSVYLLAVWVWLCEVQVSVSFSCDGSCYMISEIHFQENCWLDRVIRMGSSKEWMWKLHWCSLSDIMWLIKGGGSFK